MVTIESENPKNKEAIVTYNITGIKANLNKEKYKEKNPKQKISLQIKLDNKGIIELTTATASIEFDHPINTTKEVNETKENGDIEVVNKTVIETRRRSDKSVLKVTSKYSFPLPLNTTQKRHIENNLTTMNQKEEDKLNFSTEKNNYESLIYGIRDFIREDVNLPYMKPGEKVTLEEVLETVLSLFLCKGSRLAI